MSLLSPEVESTYEILDLMGEGGMGAVYKARHRVFNDLRVIKVMKDRLQDNAQFRARFENEARKGKQIDHPNIARVLNFFIGSNGNAHLEMEFIDGINLRHFQARRGTSIDPATVVVIGTQVLAALGCLHQNSLVHRDISPDNIMLVQEPSGGLRVKLIDLGIAKSMDSGTAITQALVFMGKPPYAAPEQFSGEVDARSDLYSFGIVLYELLTGVRPISGTNLNSWALAHHQTPPTPFSQSDPEGRVPESLQNVVMKALAKQPGRRHQSAAEFSAELTPPVSTVGPTVTIPSPQPSPPSPVPVNPLPSPSPTPENPKPIPRTRRPFSRYVAFAAILLALSGFVYAFIDRDPLTPEVKQELAGVIRKVVDERREPSVSDPSIAAFLEKNEIDPADAEPYAIEVAAKLRDSLKQIDRGKAAIARGDTLAAYEAFGEAKRIDEDNAYAWVNFGAAAMVLNKQGEAAAAYQRALAIDPNNWLAHYNIACQYARAGRMNDALGKLATAIASMRQQELPSDVPSILKKIREDDALQELRDDPRFKKLVAVR